MLDLTLQPTVIRGERLKDDYFVYFERQRVGRIRLLMRKNNGSPKWLWDMIPPLQGYACGTGTADTLDAARAAFQTAWDRFYLGLTPDEMDRWQDLAGAHRR